MQRVIPAGTVRVVSASTNATSAQYILEDDDASVSVSGLEDDGVVDDVEDESEVSSNVSSPVSLRVAQFLDSGKPNGPKKRKRAKLNHLSGDQKVERRKILNRIAAQTARDRKKVQMDELEQFVKELAAENMRLARENADLRVRSTDLEHENVKLRTHLGRPGTSGTQSQTQQLASGSSANQSVVVTSVAAPAKQQTVPNVEKTETVTLVKPIGIAARVNDLKTRATASRVTDSDVEQSNVRVSDGESTSASQQEAKRVRLANATECNRTTPNGVCDAAQRNAAAAVFVRATRTCAIQRPLCASARQFTRRVAAPVRSVGGPQFPVVPGRAGVAPGRSWTAQPYDSGRFEADACRLNSKSTWLPADGHGSGRAEFECGSSESEQQARAARYSRCAPDRTQRTAARGVLEATSQRSPHAADNRHDETATRYVGAPGRAAQRLDRAAPSCGLGVGIGGDVVFGTLEQLADDGGVARSMSGETVCDWSSNASEDIKPFDEDSLIDSETSGKSIFWNDPMASTGAARVETLALNSGHVVDDLLHLFREEVDSALQLSVVEQEVCTTNTGNRKMNELFEKLVADLEVE